MTQHNDVISTAAMACSSTESNDSFQLYLPQQHCVPLVFDSPHSGMQLPDDFNTQASLQQLQTGWDAFIDELWAPATALGASVMAARVSRMYIDLNRAPDDIAPQMLDGSWPGVLNPTAYSQRGMGLLRQWSLPQMPMYSAPLSVAAVQQRIQRYYQPYHQRLRQLLEQRYQQFGAVWHINCHSMKSRGNAMNIDAGASRADIVVGNRDGQSADGRFTALVVDSFRALGYNVSLNYPYKGGYLTHCFANRNQHRHSIQIEINRQLYMDEANFCRHQGFTGLQQHLLQVSTILADYIRSQPVVKKGKHHD
ncbi:N-formylglutamate amidohydrolase [Rheinheimera muenzenbergensis]|uniref:N-formylglutamate amidohydrolase n=1 Tax=Rheinheimera muenzenbergensis TaxID=1193628 RepID=A0ABU8C6L5_9GAMM